MEEGDEVRGEELRFQCCGWTRRSVAAQSPTHRLLKELLDAASHSKAKLAFRRFRQRPSLQYKSTKLSGSGTDVFAIPVLVWT